MNRQDTFRDTSHRLTLGVLLNTSWLTGIRGISQWELYEGESNDSRWSPSLEPLLP